MKPLITLIIPVYNTKKYLRACFESVTKQTYQNLEIILVDDGSTDDSGKLCDELAQLDSRAKVIHQQNQGLSAARNAAIKKSTGAYLTFIDSDDTVTPDYVEYLYTLIKKHHTQLSICPSEEVYNDGRRVNIGLGYHEEKLAQPDCLDRMLNEQGFTVVACAKLYARELFDTVKFPVGALHEDLDTTYRLVMQCDQIAYGPEPKYHYYQRENSITHSKFSDRKFVIIDFTDQMCDAIDREFPTLKNTTNLRRMHARFSVLRLMIGANLTKKQQERRREITTYLRRHKNRVFNNPKATRRDKLAMFAIMLSLRAFNASWHTYAKFKK